MDRHVPSRSELQERVSEFVEQRTAISEVLRAIASSPNDLQPVFDTLLHNATRLCQADFGVLRLYEEEGFRLVALKGDPGVIERWSPPALLDPSIWPVAQAISNRSPVHIADVAADQAYLQRDPFVVALVEVAGARTCLLVPMRKEDELIGGISLFRTRVQPFTDRQIELMTDFAAQATIALESTRRERQFRQTQMELAHANRVATMGQLTASIAHEVRQPIGATVSNAQAALRWLSAQPPDLEEVRQALGRIVRDASRAGEVIGSIHALVEKAPPQKNSLTINEAILEVIALLHGEALKHKVAVRMQLADGLPPVQGDRVALQQVVLNLIMNAIEAMGGVGIGPRELLVSSEQATSGEVLIAVRDTGPGLDSAQLERLFEAFHTTKPGGLGLGLSICRSIVEVHGGRLWATGCEPQGALFQFTVPAG